MKIKIWILLISILFLSLDAWAEHISGIRHVFDTRAIEGETTCTYWNDTLQREEQLPVRVYILLVDNNPKKCDTHVVWGRGILEKDMGFNEDKKGLTKFLEWAEKAKAEKLEVSKQIFKSQFMTMTFISTKNGEESYLSMRYSNPANAANIPLTVSLNIQQVQELIALINKTPETIAAYFENKKKGEVLK